MKLLIALGCLALLLSGCATLGLPDSPTAEQIREANCQDAMVGRAMAQVVLSEQSPPIERTWWTKYLAAVDVLIMSYCPGKPTEATVVVVK